MKALLISMCSLTFLLQPSMTQAKEVSEDNQQSDLHIWEVQEVSEHEIPIYSHTFNVWHHFIQKKKTCNVTNKIRVEVKYCKEHDHFKTDVTSEEVIHSHKH
ncbi:hypothetical protein GCM10011351_02180 [Paraliobacillus quinghaiensis]|uniref:Uncharacterized protein n=1 Tax=Paraliobacillus quinghaiensis TaxID=470815 RepID=A0A917TDV5_9BACI|nr:hypothetical protein [Paraliobacillus quinghaiensis]GGM19874.1 hypothetical protein GCM10011351_02180 [Paraliobacillus quinghaiensis]